MPTEWKYVILQHLQYVILYVLIYWIIQSISKPQLGIFTEEPVSISRPALSGEVKSIKPFSTLSVEEIGHWLFELGLECYAGELRKWKATGEKLLDSTPNQIEKELDIKNPLHRKKFLYAIESERCHGAGFLGSEKVIKQKLSSKNSNSKIGAVLSNYWC